MYKNVRIENLQDVATELVSLVKNQNKNCVVVYVEGVMGAGKTTFVKAFARELGITSDVQSPTFTIMREYDISDSSIKQDILLHIDAYRFEDKNEGDILELGKLVEADDKVLMLIEWAENMNAPKADIIVNILKVKDEDDCRDITFKIIKSKKTPPTPL